jgi:three-Cys-motif partner protein
MPARQQPIRTWKFWTEGKLDLLSDYMHAFNTASSKLGETNYLDLFAGTPDNQRDTGAQLAGSARRALDTDPPFSTVVLFEKDAQAAAGLRRMVAERYPGRDGRVYDGDCNDRLPEALDQLRVDDFAWRPTLAFLDPYKTNIRWESFERLAKFRVRSNYKTELLILLASPAVPRGVSVSPGFIDDVTRMFGSPYWLQPLALRQRGEITAGRFRAELGNLLRWRLENELGYHSTHLFQVRRQGESGTPLYDLIFATDNAAGDKIMRDLFTRSTKRFPEMAAAARAIRCTPALRPTPCTCTSRRGGPGQHLWEGPSSVPTRTTHEPRVHDRTAWFRADK